MTVAITRREILFIDVILQPNGPQIELTRESKPDWLLEEKSNASGYARVPVRFDHVASFIVNANRSHWI